jgi:ferredoxin
MAEVKEKLDHTIFADHKSSLAGLAVAEDEMRGVCSSAMATHIVQVKGSEPITVESGTKLVLAIEGAGIDISHRCGGLAKCTTCRVAFSSPEPEMGEVERQSLEEDGVLGQFRLACQIRVEQDMAVEVLMRASDQGWEPGPAVEP